MIQYRVHRRLPRTGDLSTQADIGRRLFEEIVEMARPRNLTMDEHFSVDGTLIAAWASHKSVRRKDGSEDENSNGVWGGRGRHFHGEQRRIETHATRMCPKVPPAWKPNGMATRPIFSGDTLIGNCPGFLADAELTQVTGTDSHEAAFDMADGLKPGDTLSADKRYDMRGFVWDLRCLSLAPNIAQNLNRARGSAIDARATRHAGYLLNQQPRKRIDAPFAWAKQLGGYARRSFVDWGPVLRNFL